MNNSSLEVESLKALSARASDVISYLIVSPFIFFSSFLIILTISPSESLQKKSHFVILSHSVAECVYSLCYFGSAMEKYLPYVYGRPVISTQLSCIISMLPTLLMGSTVIWFTLALAF